MVSLGELRAEALRGGYMLYATCESEVEANTIQDRLLEMRPKSDPSIGLFGDTFLIWYRV
jgi:hypothetical protein